MGTERTVLLRSELFERVAALSPEKLALLSLRLGTGSALGFESEAAGIDQAPPGTTTGGVTSAALIPRIPRDDVAALLTRLDELSDDEVDALLLRMRAEAAAEERATAPVSLAAPPTAAAIRPLDREHDARLLERLDRLSDTEVDSLLGELLRRDGERVE